MAVYTVQKWQNNMVKFQPLIYEWSSNAHLHWGAG